MQIKNWFIPLWCIFAILLSFIACKDKNQDKIVGTWERYDDRAAGTVVMVEKINDHFEGKIVKANGELAEDGFVENDVKWRKITPQTATYFTGEDLNKGIDKYGKVQYTDYHEVYFEIVAEDILRVTYFTNGFDDFGEKQKWKRIKDFQETYVADSLLK
ncbi:MAG: hypothetical protein R3E32_01585 [Chitinophagales bacterium]